MKATTIKVEGKLLQEIEEAKTPEQSVTAFVRAVLRKELDRRSQKTAAAEYRAFVAENAEERKWLEAWDRADLISAPTDRPEGK